MNKTVCKIAGFDEFGPLLEWSKHWSEFPVGTALARVDAAEQAQAERGAIDNPWRASLENCISGDNYLRASEYRELIAELDELYRLRAAAAEQAAQAVPAGFVLVPVEFIEAGQRVAQEYARTNPKWPMWDNGEAEPKVQDPCGVHAWLEQAAMLAAATAAPAPEAQAAGQDERAAFGAWFQGFRHGWKSEKDVAFDAWQARAALAQRQPLTDEQTEDAYGWTDADADAARLALELECILTDPDTPMPLASRWWGSAHEALALHRQRLESELSETRANVDKAPAAQSATVEEWERELSAVMPLDFKDWWQNDRHEWPAVAAAVIRSQRADCELGWKMAAEAAPSAEPLTDEQIAEGRYRMWAAELEESPEPWAFLQGARWAQKACAEAWGVKLGTSGGEVQK